MFKDERNQTTGCPAAFRGTEPHFFRHTNGPWIGCEIRSGVIWQSSALYKGPWTLLMRGKGRPCVAGVDNDLRKESLCDMMYFPGLLCQDGSLFNCVKYNTEQLLSSFLLKMLTLAKRKFGISFHPFQWIRKCLMWRCIDLLKGQQHIHRLWYYFWIAKRLSNSRNHRKKQEKQQTNKQTQECALM